MSLINREALYEKVCELEAQALSYIEKIIHDEDKVEEWKIWSAILAERTAFKHDVFDAPEVKPEPHWIPCSEKYPDQDERVIVTIGGYNIWVWDCMANRGDDYFWEDEQGFYHNKYEIDAWMPLPEPYQEGADE